MKKASKVVFMFLLAMMIGGCSKKSFNSQSNYDQEAETKTKEEVTTEITEPVTETVSQSKEKKKQILMIYMVGSNLESEAGAATEDIEEMKNSKFDEENMSVYLCTGGASFWWTDEIKSDRVSVSQIKDNSLIHLRDLESDNMGSSSTLKEFINTVYKIETGDSYSIIFWDHGGGAVLGFGADENHDYDMLSLMEMSNGLSNTDLIMDGNRFEWLGFDACLMGMLEVADMMSEFSDYMIASEEVETQYGWDYSCLADISKCCDLTGNFTADSILTSYQNSIETSFPYAPDYTLSCFDLNQVDKVRNALDLFVLAAKKDLNQKGYSKIAKQRDDVRTFGKASNVGFYDTIDLYDLADRFKEDYPDQAERLKMAVKDMVDSKVGNMTKANGVAIYFPYENKEFANEWLDQYQKIGFSPTYTDFIFNFTKILNGAQLSDWNLEESVPKQDDGNANTYSIQLTNEQLDHFARAKFSLWEKEDGENNYICWLLSSNTKIDQDGQLSGEFSGYRYYLCDDSNKKLPCCAIETEHTKEYQKFVIPVIVNPSNKDDIKVGYIHIKVDQKNPNGVVLGLYYDCDTNSVLCPDKSVLFLKEGDIVCPFYFSREILKKEDGSIAPFEQWKATSGIGDSITVKGNLTVQYDIPETHSEYCLLFDVRDTQGNSVYTNPVYIKK